MWSCSIHLTRTHSFLTMLSALQRLLFGTVESIYELATTTPISTAYSPPLTTLLKPNSNTPHPEQGGNRITFEWLQSLEPQECLWQFWSVVTIRYSFDCIAIPLSSTASMPRKSQTWLPYWVFQIPLSRVHTLALIPLTPCLCFLCAIAHLVKSIHSQPSMTTQSQLSQTLFMNSVSSWTSNGSIYLKLEIAIQYWVRQSLQSMCKPSLEQDHPSNCLRFPGLQPFVDQASGHVRHIMATKVTMQSNSRLWSYRMALLDNST